MIVLLSAKQGGGKTTTADQVAEKLKEEGLDVFRTRFAEPLYQMHDRVRDVLNDYGYQPYDYETKDGPLLQLLGTEWGRAMDQEIWVKLCKLGAEAFIQGSRDSEHTPVVIIDDCRFKNEFEAFPNALKIRLECPEIVRKARAEMWRDRTNHPSEIDLDDWVDRFDVVFHTDVTPQEEVVDEICQSVFERLGVKPV